MKKLLMVVAFSLTVVPFGRAIDCAQYGEVGPCDGRG